MQKKITIIGAGITGLSLGQMLRHHHHVTILEAADKPGGLIRCDRIEGNLFHRTGGHVFNTKRKDVLDWFWSFFHRESEFTKATRNATISLPNNQWLPYPIENHFYQLDADTASAIIADLLALCRAENPQPANFEQFLRQRFGETLYQLYFKPYNEKVWRNNLANIPLSWLEGKLPMPSVQEILFYNIKRVEEQNFVHSSFYYPICNGSQFIVDRLARNLNIKYCAPAQQVSKTATGWRVNETEADIVIFCGNLKNLSQIMIPHSDQISAFFPQIDALESHGTTTVLCETDANPYSWVYMPSDSHQSHRIICTGNFAESNNALGKYTATIEFTDEISHPEILRNLAKIPFNPKYITHHYEKYTYPIQNADTRTTIASLKNRLAHDNFFIAGRFADWEYYNMDAAIGAALDLCAKEGLMVNGEW